MLRRLHIEPKKVAPIVFSAMATCDAQLAIAQDVSGDFDVAELCSKVANYTGTLSRLVAVQERERTNRLSELATARIAFEQDYNTARIVMGPSAMFVLADKERGLRSLERKTLNCVNGNPCEISAVVEHAKKLKADLLSACRADFVGEE